jgi:hypothetical protein
VTSIGARNFALAFLSVSFWIRPRFFCRASSALSGMYENPQTPPSFMIRSAMAQAIDLSLKTPVIRPFLPSNNPMEAPRLGLVAVDGRGNGVGSLLRLGNVNSTQTRQLQKTPDPLLAPSHAPQDTTPRVKSEWGGV